MAKLDVSFKVLDASDKKIKISLHYSLRKGLLEERLMKSFIEDDNCIIPEMYPPIFFCSNKNSYQLVARHFAYAFHMNRYFKSPLIPAIVFYEEDLIDVVLKLEESELSFFSQLEDSDRPPSRATISRHKSIETGRICPFCAGELRTPRTRKKEDGLYKIACRNNGCDFYANLTDYEFDKFTRYKLPTSSWLTKIAGKSCPTCKQDLYLRVVHHSRNKVETFEKCRNHNQSAKMDCKHIIRL